MKAKNDFVSEESYREYLQNYYIPSCLCSLSNSGILGGKNLERAAINMSKDIVEVILPSGRKKNWNKPINPESEGDLS